MDETGREQPGGGGDAMQILIVEDDARIRHYLQAVLSSSGYDVLEAAMGTAPWAWPPSTIRT